MRRVYSHTIRKESYEDQIAAGRWNPGFEIVFRDRRGKHTHKISAGNSDVIHVPLCQGSCRMIQVLL